jgi:glucose-1-phosphate adenylyltransferase
MVDFGGEIIPDAIKNYNVQAYLFKDYWEDIGTIRSFFEANLDLASPLPKFNFFNTEAPIYTRSRYLPPTKVHLCDIDNSMISEGCILNGVFARRAIIGLRSRIDFGVRIENSIIMGADFFESFDEIKSNVVKSVPHIGIGENSTIRGAIIDKNARIGKNVQLVNQYGAETADGADDSYFIREGIIIIPKNATIPDNSVI